MDQVPNTFGSLFVGYTVIWVVLAAYIFSLGRRLTKLESKHCTKEPPSSHS